jgi:hypothetical protein
MCAGAFRACVSDYACMGIRACMYEPACEHVHVYTGELKGDMCTVWYSLLLYNHLATLRNFVDIKRCRDGDMTPLCRACSK